MAFGLRSNWFLISLLVLFLGLALGNNFGYAVDYRSKALRTKVGSWLPSDRVALVALSLGRATGSLSHGDVIEIGRALIAERPIPFKLIAAWEKLIRIAQIESIANELPIYFTHGYEFETIYKNHWAFEQFGAGAKKFRQLVGETFGVHGSLELSADDKEQFFWDEMQRNWKLMTETVRMNSAHDGYELVSPAFTNPEELQQIGSFIWRLGMSVVGQSNGLTGAHQTFSIIPDGNRVSSHEAGLMVVNLLLIQAQFGPTIYRILDVKRNGGFENFFTRPLVLDHQAMLHDLRNSPVSKIDLEMIDEMMSKRYMELEFDIQAKRQIEEELLDYDDYRELQRGSAEGRRDFRPAWKYRDTRVKINLSEPEKTLFEVRIGDYVSDRPEQQLLKTILYQKILNVAWAMTKRNEIFNVNLPVRGKKDTDRDYWQKLGSLTESSDSTFFEFLQIKNSNLESLLLGKKIETRSPIMRAGKKVSYAFEIEGSSSDLISLILPRDPKLRAQWRGMSYAAKLAVLKDLGFKFGSFSWDNYLTLVTEFYGDTIRFPYLSPDLHVESSGNWEIKSNRRGIVSKVKLKAAIEEIDGQLPWDYYGLHSHIFLPDSYANDWTTAEKEKFVSFLEKLSFYMTLVGYSESDRNSAPHHLDSWSLDRFSVQDLNSILAHLNNEIVLNSTSQKFHNVGFRPVDGGIDIELRDLGDDISYASKLVRIVVDAIESKDFGGHSFLSNNPLFMEFRDYEIEQVARYTLGGALADSGYKLEPTQSDLLKKFQFEIYKPFMEDYMEFSDHTSLGEAKDNELDIKYARTNFENNLAIPLLNYDDQKYISKNERSILKKQKLLFLQKVFGLLKSVQKDSKYAFLGQHDSFLHLADWLKRSTHQSRPRFDLVSDRKAAEQRKLLEGLVYQLRGFVVEFIKNTDLVLIIEAKIDPLLKKQKDEWANATKIFKVKNAKKRERDRSWRDIKVRRAKF